MLYLTGSSPADPALRKCLIDAGVGVLTSLQSSRSARPQCHIYPYYGIDTGLFGPRNDFDLSTYLRKLDTLPRDTCLLVTAPDVFGDGAATLRMSLDVLPRIRALGFPAAFVAQPGVPEYPWDDFDCLFMGGPDEFKQTVGQVLLEEAKRRGKWCHIGRVNSTVRYLWAREQGYDSADGTHIAFCPTVNAKRVMSWVTSARQEVFNFGGEE
ncbi:MAG: hypothetical protein WKF67_05725 [Rubrobacteraceae bacterium]